MWGYLGSPLQAPVPKSVQGLPDQTLVLLKETSS